MTNTIKQAMLQAQAEADQWMEENGHLLDSCREISNAQSNGNECASGTGETETEGRYDPFYLLAKIECDNGFWADTVNEQTMIEQGGIFNVTTLKHWSAGTREQGIVTSYRDSFDAEAFEAHKQRQANKRAQFGIDWAKSNRSQTVKFAQKTAKVDKVSKHLSNLQRRAAAAAARKARAA
jgi:hypothetical protein